MSWQQKVRMFYRKRCIASWKARRSMLYKKIMTYDQAIDQIKKQIKGLDRHIEQAEKQNS